MLLCAALLGALAASGVASGPCTPSDAASHCSPQPYIAPEPCVCRLGCFCGDETPTGVASAFANCSCEHTAPVVETGGYFAWFTAEASSGGAALDYSVASDGFNPPLVLSGTVANDTGGAVARVAVVRPFDAFGDTEMTLSVVYHNVSTGQNGTAHASDAWFMGGVIPCTPTTLSAYVAQTLDPVLQLQWPQLPHSVGSLLHIDVQIQNLKNATNKFEPPFETLVTLPGTVDRVSWTFTKRQCAPLNVRLLTRLNTVLAQPVPVEDLICPAPSLATTFLLHTTPDIPSVTIGTVTKTSVLVSFSVSDGGGCSPLIAHMHLFRRDDDTLVASRVFNHTGIATPWKSSTTLSVPDDNPLAAMGDLYVTVVASTPAGQSSPGLSDYFSYQQPRLPPGDIFAVVGGLVAVGVVLVIVVCCLYRGHRRRLEEAAATRTAHRRPEDKSPLLDARDGVAVGYVSMAQEYKS